jgi:hypothetical protein
MMWCLSSGYKWNIYNPYSIFPWQSVYLLETQNKKNDGMKILVSCSARFLTPVMYNSQREGPIVGLLESRKSYTNLKHQRKIASYFQGLKFTWSRSMGILGLGLWPLRSWTSIRIPLMRQSCVKSAHVELQSVNYNISKSIIQATDINNFQRQPYSWYQKLSNWKKKKKWYIKFMLIHMTIFFFSNIMCKIIPLLPCRLLCKNNRCDQAAHLHYDPPGVIWITSYIINFTHGSLQWRNVKFLSPKFLETTTEKTSIELKKKKKRAKEGLFNTYWSRWGVTIWRGSSPGWLRSRRLGSLHRNRTMLVVSLPPTHTNFIYWNASPI